MPLFQHWLPISLILATVCAAPSASADNDDGQTVFYKELEFGFEAADTNDDGKLDVDETIAAIIPEIAEQVEPVIGRMAETFAKEIAPQVAENLFGDMDTDSDGLLTREETTPRSE